MLFLDSTRLRENPVLIHQIHGGHLKHRHDRRQLIELIARDGGAGEGDQGGDPAVAIGLAQAEDRPHAVLVDEDTGSNPTAKPFAATGYRRTPPGVWRGCSLVREWVGLSLWWR